MMKRFCLFLIVALIVSMLPGFAVAEQKDWITAEDISDMPQTTIRYWYYETAERIELGKKQVEEFQKLFPNITVQGSAAPDNTDNEMLMSYVQTQTNSNIHQSVNIEDLWYVDYGMLYPLNNFPDFEEFYARFDPDLNYTHADGNVYSISWYLGPYVMYYNKAMLEAAGFTEPPQTYSEYYQFAEAVTDPAKKVVAISPWTFEEWWRWEFTVLPLYIAAKGDSKVFTEDGSAADFDNKAGVDSLTFYAELFKNGWASGNTFDIDPFVSGNAASCIQNASMVKTLARNAAEDFEYVIGPIPHPDDVEGFPIQTFAFVRNFAIVDELYAKSDDERDRIRRASWEFMKFLLSDEQSAADFEASGDLPCIQGFQDNPAFQEAIENFGPTFETFLKAADMATIGDTSNHMACEVMDPLQQAYLRVVLNGEDPAAALAQAEQEANQIIAEGRE